MLLSMSGSVRPRSRSPRPVLALVGATALWGTATAAIKCGLRGFDPLTFLLVEFLAADALLWMMLWCRGRRRPRHWRTAVVLGALEAMVNIADTEGLSVTSAGHASVLYGLESVFVVLLARCFLREPVTRPLVGALVLAAVGLLALEGVPSSGIGQGDLVIATGVACAAVYTVCARTSATRDSPLELTTALFSVGTAVVLALAVAGWSTGHAVFPSAVAPGYWIVAVLTGMGGLAGGLLLYNVGIGRVSAGSASVVVNLAPVFGLGTAALLLAEPLTVAAVTGALMIGASAAVVAVREATRHRPTNGRELGDSTPVLLPAGTSADPAV